MKHGIVCRVEECVFQKDCECTAECIEVGCDCGCAVSSQQTECCTFRKKQ